MKKSFVSVTLLLALVVSLVLPACSAGDEPLDVSQYTIVIPENATDYEERAARYIKTNVLSLTGTELLITDDSSEAADHEILVGATNRPLSTQAQETETTGLEFVINADKHSVALYGEYFIVAAAAYYFVEQYVTEAGISAAIPQTASVYTPTPEKAKNYFLLIGDGMGEYQTKLIEYFGYDNDTYQTYSDQEPTFYGYLLPNQGTVKTYSLSGTTDSAAAATAMATGYHTYNRYIGKDADGNDLKSLTELAVELGFRTAVMSTEASTGATPAAFSAHALSRFDAETILASQALMTETEIRYGFNNKSILEIEMLVGAELSYLDDGTGSFMMYEEAYIDKHCTKNDMDSTYFTVLRFNQVIGLIMEFAFYNPDTVVIITADHECGGLVPDANGQLTFTSTDHTGFLVPIFAYGEGTEYFSNTEIKNVDIAKFIAGMWGVEDFGQ